MMLSDGILTALLHCFRTFSIDFKGRLNRIPSDGVTFHYFVARQQLDLRINGRALT